MCGIVGVISKEGASAVTKEMVLKARETMHSRGPDDEGYWSTASGQVQLAHRRLAIIDLSPRGRQPLADASGRFTMVYNGEVYNYQSLRTELENLGHSFRSTSDSEVVIELFARFGAACFARLRGMYSIAIWDDLEGQLTLHRDPNGIKPLYYAHGQSGFYFASQLRALFEFPAISKEIDPVALSSFYLLGSVAEPNTIVKSVRSVVAGETIQFSAKGGVVSTEFDNAGQVTSSCGSIGDIVVESVKAHLVSDAPCGFFLSAGIDSSVLLAAASMHGGGPLHTVTLGFEQLRNSPQDETKLAELTAARLGTKHSTVWVGDLECRGLIDTLFEAMDQPSIDGMNTLLVSKAAKQAGLTVALSGLGGDELFSGYPSFSSIPRILTLGTLSKSVPGAGKYLRQVVAFLLRHLDSAEKISPKYAGILEYGNSLGGAYLLRRGLFMPWEISQSVPELQQSLATILQRLVAVDSQVDGGSLNRKIAMLEWSWYMRNQLLRDTDWASMANSLEVRVPFVDREVFYSAMKQDYTKKVLVDAFGSQLPSEILTRPKTGFVVPVREWICSLQPDLASMRGLRGWSQYVVRRYCEKHNLDLRGLEI